MRLYNYNIYMVISKIAWVGSIFLNFNMICSGFLTELRQTKRLNLKVGQIGNLEIHSAIWVFKERMNYEKIWLKYGLLGGGYKTIEL